MAEMTDNIQAVAGALYPMALPQTVVPITKTQTQVSRTQYDPNKLRAVMAALSTPRSTQRMVDALNAPRNTEIGTAESIARALASMPEQRSFTGAYGTEVINPWTSLLGSGMRAYGTAYGDRASAKREADNLAREDAIKAAQIMTDAENAAREDAIKAAQLDLEADKAQIATQIANDYLKINDPNAGGDTAYRFTPERIQEMKELNDKAGRWSTEWGAGMSDMMNTETAQAWTEFEGLAKQYVQDQLKKIYGASMTEQEGERFFKSMGLSRYTDPSVRWSLLTHQLNDLAIKNGVRLQLDPIPGQNTTTVAGTNMQQQGATNARPLPQKGQIVDGYEFLGGDPADAKNWRAK